MTKSRRSKKRDTLLAHCIARAVIHDQGGIDAAVERYGPRAERLSKWGALRAAARVTPKASRVAAFIVMWAVAMKDEAVEELTISHYQRYWNLSERQAYREQSEFRDLWPELETPNEFGRQLADALDAKLSKRQIATLPNSLMVNAEQPA